MNLAKTFSLTLIFLAFTVAASAQIGVKGGVNFGVAYGTAEEVNGEAIESVSPGLGYQIGLFTNLNFTDNVGLMIEVNYEAKRSSKEVSEFTISSVPSALTGLPVDVLVNASADQDNSFDFINVPVLFNFGGEGLSFYVGPNIGYMIGGKVNVASTVASVYPEGVPDAAQAQIDGIINAGLAAEGAALGKADTELDLIDTERVNQLILGANVGVMFNLSDNLFLDLRLNHDLTDFTNNDLDVAQIDPSRGALRDDKDRNVNAQLTVGFKF